MWSHREMMYQCKNSGKIWDFLFTCVFMILSNHIIGLHLRDIIEKWYKNQLLKQEKYILQHNTHWHIAITRESTFYIIKRFYRDLYYYSTYEKTYHVAYLTVFFPANRFESKPVAVLSLECLIYSPGGNAECCQCDACVENSSPFVISSYEKCGRRRT